jgi:type IV secretory pathway TraG/TraD family ATPase VirD4
MTDTDRLTHGHRASDFSAKTDNFFVGLFWAVIGFSVMALVFLTLIGIALVQTQPNAIWPLNLAAAAGVVLLGWRFGFRNYAIGANMLSPRRETTVTGSARMGTKDDLIEAGLIGKDAAREDRIYCGTFNDEDIFYRGERHIGIVGPSGYGKDTGYAFRNLKDCSRPFVVIDAKGGEMAAVTARWREKYGPVVIIKPYPILRESHPHLESVGFNPIADLDPDDDDFFTDANSIGEAAVIEDDDNRFFVDGARSLITLGIMSVSWRSKKGELKRRANLDDVNELLMLPHTSPNENDRTLQKELRILTTHSDPQVRRAAGRLIPDNKTNLSVISTAITALNNLNDRCIASDLKKTPIINDKRFPEIHGKPFHFGMLRDYPITAYVILPEGKLVAQAVWLRLMVASAINGIRKEVPSTKRPILLINEAGNLGKLHSLQASMGMGRGKFTVWTIFQDLGQIALAYGEKGLGSFVQGWGFWACFACKDPFTAKYVSDYIGTTTEYLRSYDAASRLASKGHGDQPTGITLRQPDALRRMKERKAVVWCDPCVRPFEVDVPCYDPRGLDPSPYHDKKQRA